MDFFEDEYIFGELFDRTIAVPLDKFHEQSEQIAKYLDPSKPVKITMANIGVPGINNTEVQTQPSVIYHPAKQANESEMITDIQKILEQKPLEPSKRQYECPICKHNFKRGEHLKRHMRTHTGLKPFSCPHQGCKKSFSRRDNLSQHLKTHQRPHLFPFDGPTPIQMYESEVEVPKGMVLRWLPVLTPE